MCGYIEGHNLYFTENFFGEVRTLVQMSQDRVRFRLKVKGQDRGSVHQLL